MDRRTEHEPTFRHGRRGYHHRQTPSWKRPVGSAVSVSVVVVMMFGWLLVAVVIA
jgi:hypothetical protein